MNDKLYLCLALIAAFLALINMASIIVCLSNSHIPGAIYSLLQWGVFVHYVALLKKE